MTGPVGLKRKGQARSLPFSIVWPDSMAKVVLQDWAMGDCRHCGKKAGFFRSAHRECEEIRSRGWEEMVAAAAQAAGTSSFSSTQLRLDLLDIAKRSFFDGEGINAAISEGWRRAIKASLSDGIITQEEEARLREFRDRFAIQDRGDDESAALGRAARDRVMLDARLAALAARNGQAHLDALSDALGGLDMTPAEESRLLVQAWEAAVEGYLEDGVLSLDEEAALVRYLAHFNLRASDVNGNGAHLNMVKSAALRELSEGIVPERQNHSSHTFNLMKSEKLVWLFDGVEYIETKTIRERRGTSHGVSVRIVRGLYYRPSAFRSRVHEWEETVLSDRGLLGVTTKHIYFHGRRKRFRVRLDKIVSFEPYSDGIGIMRDTQSAKPEIFGVGDGWFIYNLVTNLSSL